MTMANITRYYQPGQLEILNDHKDALKELEGQYLVLEKQMGRYLVEIGRHLAAVRDLLRHNKQGGFDEWVEMELKWSRASVYRFIQVFEKMATVPNLGQLSLPASTLYLLAENSTPQTARDDILKRAEQGEQLTFKAVEETIRRYRRNTPIVRSGSRLGNKKTTPKPPPDSGGGQGAVSTFCVFCQAHNQPVYALDASGQGICLPCARKAVRYLEGHA